MKLNLYSVSNKYIKYLKKFDNRIYDNKEDENVHTRKYIGVVLNINSFNYYIPFSSPKTTDYYDNTKIRKSVIPIIRMTEKDIYNNYKLYGTLRVSNMIPVPITELTPYYVQEEKDINYRNLILSELRFINKNTNMIIKNAKVLYKQKENNAEIAYVKNSLNFKLLENKCLEYINVNSSIKGKIMEERIRLAGILPIENGFAFMHRVGVKNHPIGDYYTFPGGGREGEESFEDGVKREIKEEFGIDVEVQELLYETSSIDDIKRNSKEYFYLCKYISGKFGTGDGPEFNNDPKYADRGKYLPEIVNRQDVEHILLLPYDIRDKFIKDVKNGRF